MLVYLALVVLIFASWWKIFTKAGKPPVWFVLLLIPCVNFIVAIMLLFELAKVFGKGAGFGLGLLFLGIIFLPMLAFGDAQYQGPSASA